MSDILEKKSSQNLDLIQIQLEKFQQEEEREINNQRKKIHFMTSNIFSQYKNKIKPLNYQKEPENKIRNQFRNLLDQFKKQNYQNYKAIEGKISQQLLQFKKRYPKYVNQNKLQQKVDQAYYKICEMLSEQLTKYFNDLELINRMIKKQEEFFKIYVQTYKNSNEGQIQEQKNIDCRQYFEKQNQIFLEQNLPQFPQKIEQDFKEWYQKIKAHQEQQQVNHIGQDKQFPKLIQQDRTQIKKIAEIQDEKTHMENIVQIFNEHFYNLKNQNAYYKTIFEQSVISLQAQVNQYLQKYNLQGEQFFIEDLIEKLYHNFFDYLLEQQNKQRNKLCLIIQQESQQYFQMAQEISNEQCEYGLAISNLRNEIKTELKNTIFQNINTANLLHGLDKNEMQITYIIYQYLQNDVFSIFQNQYNVRDEIIKVYKALLKIHLNGEKQKIQQYSQTHLKNFNYIIKECSKQKNIKQYIKVFKRITRSKKLFRECSLQTNQIFENKLKESIQFKGFKTIMDEIYYECVQFVEGEGDQQIFNEQNLQQLIEENAEIQYGCEQTCPFCGSICSSLDQNDDHNHFCDFHYPQFFKGCRNFFNDQVVFESCITKVKSKKCFIMGQHWAHPYKDYQNHPSNKLKKWIIEGEENKDIIEIFKYILSKHKSDFWAKYEYKIQDFESEIKNKKQLGKRVEKQIKCKIIKDYLAQLNFIIKFKLFFIIIQKSMRKYTINLLHEKKTPKDFENYRNNLLQENKKNIENFLNSFIYDENKTLKQDIQSLKLHEGDHYKGNLQNDLRNGKGICYYNNKDVYFGDWKDDLMDGFGIYIFQNGEKYIGNLIQGEKSGKGTYYYINGNVYKGDWKNGQKNGKGYYYFFSMDEVYEGDFVNNMRQGNGMYQYCRGDKYIGEFKQNKRDGLGEFQYKDGSYIKGFWKENLLEGQGKQFNVNTNETYEGNYFKNKKSGYGIYRYTDGSYYDGNWSNDMKDGHGKFIFLNRDEFVGNWKVDLKSGQGIYKYQNGDVFKGEYQNDKKNGIGQMKYANGDHFRGYWLDGLQSGEGSYEGNWSNGMKNGYGTYIWNNGEQFSGIWKDDMIHGRGKFTNLQNQVYNVVFEEGQLVKKEILNTNNQVINFDLLNTIQKQIIHTI